jgi:hypothetical protein
MIHRNGGFAMAYDEKQPRRVAAPAAHRPQDGELRGTCRIALFLRVSAGLLLLLGAAARLPGQDDSRDLLLRVRQSVMDTVERLPKYVCTQTIDRDRYEPESRGFAPLGRDRKRSCDDISADVKSPGWNRRRSSSDRLRLDVAVTHNLPGVESEMYSWAGEGGFSDRSLFEVVPDGAVSTGSFASLLASIFGGATAARFSYNGDSTVDGRVLSEFGFRIPEEKSDYLYLFGGSRKQQTTIGYHGTFLVDPKTAELVRLSMGTSELPAETGACELSQTLDYGRVTLNGADFLLPTETRVSLIHTDESEAENRIRYSACHEFRGESTVRYEPAPAVEPAALVGHPVRALALPAGLAFRLSFTERIDTATAAAGDLIRAKLTTAIRDQSSKVLVPEGSAVTGRIVSIRHYYPASRPQHGGAREANGQYPPLVLAVKLETLEVGGVTHPFKATSDSRVQRFAKVTGGLSQQVDLGPLDRQQDRDAGVFDFWDKTPGYLVESGMESSWVTVAP